MQFAVSMNPLAALPPGITRLSALRILEIYYCRLVPSDAAVAARLKQVSDRDSAWRTNGARNCTKACRGSL